MYKECSYRPAINDFKGAKPKVYEPTVKPVEEPKVEDPETRKQKQRVLEGFLERMKRNEREKREKELIAEQIRKMREEEHYKALDIKANLRNNTVKASANDKAIRQTIKPKNFVKKPLYRRNDEQGRESGTSVKTLNMLGKEINNESEFGVSQAFELKLDEFVSLNFIIKP